MLNVKRDLIGKTISGIVAVPGDETRPGEIWMMQFSDGTHVEFVSPQARRGLRRSAYQAARPGQRRKSNPQLTLNVA